MFSHLRSTPFKVWLLTIGHIVVDLPAGAFFIALPFFKAHFNLNYLEITFAPMLFNLTGSVSQPFFGYFSDKRHVPLRMPLGCFLSSFGLLLCLTAPTYQFFLFATVISGIGSAVFHPEASKFANLYSASGSKGKGFSLFVIGGYTGAALGSLLMGFILQHQNFLWNLVFILPPLLLFRPLYLSAAHHVPKVLRKRTKQLFKFTILIPLFLILSILFFRSFIASGLSTFVPMYLINLRNLSSESTGTILAIMMFCSVFGTYFGGFLNDKFGYKKVLIWSFPPIMLTLYFFQTLPTYFACIFIALNSVFVALSWTSLMLLAQNLMPGNLATASALTQGFALGMGSLIVVFLGKIADLYGVQTVFTLIMYLPVITFFLSLFIKKQKTL